MNHRTYTIASTFDYDYVTIISDNSILVYKNDTLILNYDTCGTEISGAVYIYDTLFYTKKGENIIYSCKNNVQNFSFAVMGYQCVTILKYLSNTQCWVVLDLNNSNSVLYDLKKQKILFYLPIQHNFIDLAIVKSNSCVMIGEDKKSISRYLDDSDFQYTKICKFKFDIDTHALDIIDNLQVLTFQDNWNDKESSMVRSINNMKLPLFDCFLYSFPKEMSISSLGNYIVYYCENIEGIILSEITNGNIFRLFSLPKKHVEGMQYYFNEQTNAFTIIHEESIERYIIVPDSNQTIQKLNELYNYAFERKASLSGNIKFKNLFYKEFMGAQCMKEKDVKFKYDVALSFAGENRQYVEKIANLLREQGIRVFYDKFEIANLWGKDLYQYLSDIYKNKAEYCVIFVSKYYKEKAWTKHELRNAQNRAFLENKEYILPIFIDDVDLNGLNDTIGYIRAQDHCDYEIANLIITKLAKNINPFSSCHDLETLLDLAIKNIYNITKTDYNQIILNSATDSHSLGLVVVADIISAKKQKYRVVSVDGAITSSYGSCKIVNIPDTTKEKTYLCAVVETRSELVVPIKINENVVGVINIESEQKNYFSDEIVDKIKKLSNNLGIMLNIIGFNIQDFKNLPYVTYNA